MIRLDNINFVIDKQVFHPQFFMLVKLVLGHIVSECCLTEHRFGYDYRNEGHFHRMKDLSMQIGSKVMFDFLTHFYENATMHPIQDSMTSILTFSDSYVSFANESEPSVILDCIQRTYLDDNCEYFFEIMFKCVDQQARDYIGKLTASVFNKAMRIYGICSQDPEQKDKPKVVQLGKMIDEFMTKCILVLQTKDFQKSWSRFKQYLEFLCQVGTGGSFQTQWLLSKFDIIADLLDFVMQDKSPRAAKEDEARISMGGQVPIFGRLINLICHLIRSCHSKYMVENELEERPRTFALFSHETERDQPKQPLQKQNVISEEALSMFTDEKFFEIVFKQDCDHSEFGKAISHVMYGEKAFSKSICTFLLTKIARSDYEKASSYLSCVEEVVLANEKPVGKKCNLQQKRLEWIFGFGCNNFCQTPERLRIGLD
jgi:hypothetical protein